MLFQICDKIYLFIYLLLHVLFKLPFINTAGILTSSIRLSPGLLQVTEDNLQRFSTWECINHKLAIFLTQKPKIQIETERNSSDGGMFKKNSSFN